jgi:soluble lytic murein transglycosylase-like protein
MQFTLPTWAWAMREGWAPAGSSPMDPYAAIPAGHGYMRWLEARTAGWDPALGAYNAGLGSVQRAERLAPQLGFTGSDAWQRALPHVTGPANAKQTQDYVARIHRFRAEYRALRGE